MPVAVWTYPAGAGTIMMPLTPNNKYMAIIMFSGGSNVPTDQWRVPDFNAIETPTSASCVQITHDVSGKYRDAEPSPEPRVLTSLILLLGQTIAALNGYCWLLKRYLGHRPVVCRRSDSDSTHLRSQSGNRKTMVERWFFSQYHS
ncbi:copper radical oxidase [Laccaria amethystina LaAM-08-1]|uniref:Copper radical oxidase n=1 Tax=Laccaria amethystina LaAM-08-1 TaxID=1095629 RepID=A0A0C9WUQ4_9AGAR|nr:copper radical oxidase [Laccaria amethystina LaAM-08-1]